MRSDEGAEPEGIVLPLARAVHDRAGIRRADESWLASAWPKASVLLLTPDRSVEVDEGPSGHARLRLRSSEEVPDDAQRLFLGEHGGTAYFAALSDEPDLAEGQWAGLRDLGAALDDLSTGLLTSAVALANWHASHPRCPRCGEPTTPVLGGWSRRCETDGSEHFPRTDPAVIMLVHDGGDRCVLGRQAVWPEGRYSVLAGFVEPGESAEAAVAREVAEEVDLQVTDIRYVASQPWPFPASLMLGFTARAVGDETLHRVDGELADAQWFSRDQIRGQDGVGLLPSEVSIAYRLIMSWLDAG